MKETTTKLLPSNASDGAIGAVIDEMEQNGWRHISAQFNMLVFTFDREIPEDRPEPPAQQMPETLGQPDFSGTVHPSFRSDLNGSPRGDAEDSEHPTDYGGFA